MLRIDEGWRNETTFTDGRLQKVDIVARYPIPGVHQVVDPVALAGFPIEAEKFDEKFFPSLALGHPLERSCDNGGGVVLRDVDLELFKSVRYPVQDFLAWGLEKGD